MADLPILFSDPMVRAIVAGHKTQTRRILPKPPPVFGVAPGRLCDVALEQGANDPRPRIRVGRVITTMPVRYAPGDRLWVRECVRAEELPDGQDVVRYRATDTWQAIPNSTEGSENWLGLRGACSGRIGRWRPSIHMPRWCSRIRLDVTDVRIQRLQEITLDDAIAEGAPLDPNYWDTTADGSSPPMVKMGPGRWQTPRLWFHRLWDEINGKDAWDANPWIVAVTFTPTVRIIAREHA